MTFTVWENSDPKWFNYKRTVKRRGTAKNTIEADTPAIAAEQYASTNMRPWERQLNVIVCNEHGKNVLVAIVALKAERTFEVKPI